jgi:nucleotide-binding universal stress UspA family protein
MFPIRTILFATDFSPCSEYAFQLASALAQDYHARLLIAHVHEVSTAAYGEFGALPPAEEDADAARERLLALRPPKPNVNVEYLLAEGDAASQIQRLAEEHDCDLIVLGSHGRRGLERFLMGSVAELVVRRAHCPVLVAKQKLPERGRAADATVESETEPAAVN